MNDNLTFARIRSICEVPEKILELDDDSFEEIVFYAIRKRLHTMHFDNAVLERNRRGPIDIQILIPHKIPFRDDSYTRIFVECKRYNRKVSLDSAAKAFCCALTEAPEVLMILSPFGLYPQAERFAHALFKERQFIPNFSFYDLRLVDLVEGELSSHSVASINENEITRFPKLEILECAVLRETPSGITRIPHDDDTNKTLSVTLSPDSTLILSVHVKSLLPYESLQSPFFLDSDGSRSIGFHRPQLKKIGDSGLLYQFRVREGISHFHPSHLVFSTPAHRHEIPSRSPNIEIHQNDAFGIDLRQELTRKIYQERFEATPPQIFFLSGAGGVGKTFLCRKLAVIAREQHRFVSRIFTLDECSTVNLFFRILLDLVLPPGDTEELSSLDAAGAILQRLIERISPAVEDSAITEVANCQPNEHTQAETLIGLCARVLAESEQRISLVFRNCHVASAEFITHLRILRNSLEDRNWGQVTLTFEYRDSEEECNDTWREFVAETKADPSISVNHLELSPLTLAELTEGLSSLFVGEDGGFIAGDILRIAGGNPFHVVQCLKYLVDLGVVSTVKNHSGITRLSVEDGNWLTQEIREIPSQVETLLKLRLERVVRKADTENSEKLIRLLILLALGGPVTERQTILHFLPGFEPVVDGFISMLAAKEILNQDGGDTIRFSHDYFHLAANHFAKGLEITRTVCEELTGRASSGDYAHCRIAGNGMFLMGDFYKARRWFDSAWEVSAHLNNLTWQEVAVDGSWRCLQALMNLGKVYFRDLVVIGTKLGELQFQTGGQLRALETFQGVHRMLEAPSFSSESELSSEEIEDALNHIVINQVTIFHRRLLPAEGVREIAEALRGYVSGANYEMLLSRFVIICFNCSLTHLLNENLGNLLKFLTTMEDSEAVSRLLSDFGNLYLHESPQMAARLWEVGANYATNERQTTHSLLNVLISHFLLGHDIREELSDCVLRIKSQGVKNQLIRARMLSAAIALGSGRRELALREFIRCAREAQILNLKFLEWQAMHNAAVILFLNEKWDRGIDYLIKVMTILGPSLDFATDAASSEIELCSKALFDQMPSRMGGGNLSFSFTELPESRACGTFRIAGANLENLFRLFENDETLTFNLKALQEWRDRFKRLTTEDYQSTAEGSPLKIKHPEADVSFFLALE